VIREAGTHQRPSADAFEFKPSPSSPIYGHFSRKSMDAGSMRSRTWRDSTQSLPVSDRGTQTDDAGPDSSRRNSRPVSPPIKESQDVLGRDRHESPEGERRDSFSDIDSDVEIHEAPVVMKAKTVTVPKRVPPALPPRNPGRVSSPSPLHAESPVQGVNDGFDQIDLNGSAEKKSEDNQNPEPTTRSRAQSIAEDDKFQSIPNSPVKELSQAEAMKGQDDEKKEKDGWAAV
jgi:hypothetical protein